MSMIRAFSHVTLTVSNLETSVAWYASALGMNKGPDMNGPRWQRTLMRAGPGVVIGLQTHERTPEGDRFDEARVGLDHISIACDDRTEIEAWLARLDDVGVPHSAISAQPANVATCRDPDGIVIEFFAPRT